MLTLPRQFLVAQHLAAHPLADPADEVVSRLAALDGEDWNGCEVAVGLGSRGIDRIALVARTVVEWLHARGAVPFIFPAMGSHGGGTPQGQIDLLASYGITETTVGASIRAGDGDRRNRRHRIGHPCARFPGGARRRRGRPRQSREAAHRLRGRRDRERTPEDVRHRARQGRRCVRLSSRGLPARVRNRLPRSVAGCRGYRAEALRCGARRGRDSPPRPRRGAPRTRVRGERTGALRAGARLVAGPAVHPMRRPRGRRDRQGLQRHRHGYEHHRPRRGRTADAEPALRGSGHLRAWSLGRVAWQRHRHRPRGRRVDARRGPDGSRRSPTRTRCPP